MTDEKRKLAAVMLEKNISVCAVTKALGAAAKKPITKKQVRNLQTRYDANSMKGDTEGKNVQIYLADLKKHTDGIFMGADNLGSETTQCIIILTPDKIKFTGIAQKFYLLMARTRSSNKTMPCTYSWWRTVADWRK